MLHVRKGFSKKEIEEYERWKQKHADEIAQFEKQTRGTKQQREALASAFWQREANERSLRRQVRGEPEVPSHAITSEPLPKQSHLDHLKDLDDQQREELQRREEAARLETEQKKQRTAPAYNKGGAVYWTEEMAKDLSGGGHRRR